MAFTRLKIGLVLALLFAVFLFVALAPGYVVMIILAVLIYVRDRSLGVLAGWAISKAPVAYVWEIERICIRPCWSKSSTAWTEVTVVNWTWHNPPGFDGAPPSYVLQIDRLALRLTLFSVIKAIRRRDAVEVDSVIIEGLRFRTQRNDQGALNLWTALNLPDKDVNIKTIVEKARQHGGLRAGAADGLAQEIRRGAGPDIKVAPLHPVATDATRAASKYWRPEWGDRDAVTAAAPPPRRFFQLPARWQRKGSEEPTDAELGRKEPDLIQPLVSNNFVSGYQEYPIGDRRRRPRWGVPLRFDIRQLFVLRAELWILDLMLLDAHKISVDPDKTKLGVRSLDIPRSRLEKGDPRRSGANDGVHGVYLGEIVWVLIAEIVPLVLKESPSHLLKNAMLASVYAVTDLGIRVGARGLELALTAQSLVAEEVNFFLNGKRTKRWSDQDCRLCVHLLSGRRITRKGRRVNVYAKIDLQDAVTPGHGRDGVVDSATSDYQMWTKKPCWNEHFQLGPVTSVRSTVRVACYHRRTKDIVNGSLKQKNDQHYLLGEIVLALTALLIEDSAIAPGGEMVGWFPLVQPRQNRRNPVSTGELKLGLRLVNDEHLADLDHVNEGEHVFFSDANASSEGLCSERSGSDSSSDSSDERRSLVTQSQACCFAAGLAQDPRAKRMRTDCCYATGHLPSPPREIEDGSLS